MFVNAPSSFIATSNTAILHILNSKVADYYIRSLGVTRNGGYFEYKPMFVGKLPIPKQCLDTLNAFPIQSTQKQEIACIVYDIYGFSSEEIEYIEKRKY